MIQESVSQKLSWRLKELPAATGLSLPFWRKVVSRKRIKARKVEGAILILDCDLREFLEGTQSEKESGETETCAEAA